MWNYCFVRDIISWDTELSTFTEGEEVPYKLYLKILESVWLCGYKIIILNLLGGFMQYCTKCHFFGCQPIFYVIFLLYCLPLEQLIGVLKNTLKCFCGFQIKLEFGSVGF